MKVVKSKTTLDNIPSALAQVTSKEKITEVAPKVGRIQFNHIIITTDQIGKNSDIIMSSTGDTDKALLSEVQTVIAAGPTAGAYKTKLGTELSIQPGDKILVDTGLLSAKRVGGGEVRLINFQFSKSTGDLITSINDKDFDKDDRASYIMISDREILMVLP